MGGLLCYVRSHCAWSPPGVVEWHAGLHAPHSAWSIQILWTGVADLGQHLLQKQSWANSQVGLTLPYTWPISKVPASKCTSPAHIARSVIITPKIVTETPWKPQPKEGGQTQISMGPTLFARESTMLFTAHHQIIPASPDRSLVVEIKVVWEEFASLGTEGSAQCQGSVPISIYMYVQPAVLVNIELKTAPRCHWTPWSRSRQGVSSIWLHPIAAQNN